MRYPMRYPMRYLAFLLLGAILALPIGALSQAPTPVGQIVGGAAQYRSTVNGSVTITTGNTFQTVLPTIIGTSTSRQSLTIQNNNTGGTDSCWVFLGSGSATVGKSISLAVGQAYTRFWPYVPPDAIQATCATTNDTLYVDTQ